MSLTYQEIAEILRILDTSSIDEFVVEVGEFKLAVRRKSAQSSEGDVVFQTSKPDDSVPQPRSQTPASAPSQRQTTDSQPAEGHTERTDGLTQVRAPMSGIFYSKPSADAEPFVSIGSKVKRGDSLCLVEVMKLFNTIRAEVDGRILEISAEDGDLVEYDQVLFVIEPIQDVQ